MQFLSRLLFVIVIAAPALAQSSTFQFKARCGLDSPTIRIQLTADPRQEISCSVQDKKVTFHLAHPVDLIIGAQTYNVRQDWETYEDSCAKAMESFSKAPELYLSDPELGYVLVAFFDSKFREVSISRGLAREACKGKAP